MIDTDKYEGHTEGPWEVTESWNIAVASDGYGLMSVEMIMNTKDLVLMADAPLLLQAYNEKCEEVKRLRKWKAEVERICRTMNGPNRDTALFIMTNEVEEE